jgi:hypothetical protein
MPLVSSFFGIRIYTYYRDHGLPHYHAFYQGFEATVLISNGHLLAGELPISVCRILEEWTKLRHNELMQSWRLAQFGEAVLKIPGADQ